LSSPVLFKYLLTSSFGEMPHGILLNPVDSFFIDFVSSENEVDTIKINGIINKKGLNFSFYMPPIEDE